MFLIILIGYSIIGIQPYCTVNKEDQRIECNYEDRDTCEAYRQSNEICIPNPNLK